MKHGLISIKTATNLNFACLKAVVAHSKGQSTCARPSLPLLSKTLFFLFFSRQACVLRALRHTTSQQRYGDTHTLTTHAHDIEELETLNLTCSGQHRELRAFRARYRGTFLSSQWYTSPALPKSSLSCCHIDKSPRVYQEAPARPQFQHRPSSCWLRLHLYETGTRRVTHPYARGMLPTTQEPPLSSVTDWSDLSDEHRLVRTCFVQNATTIT